MVWGEHTFPPNVDFMTIQNWWDYISLLPFVGNGYCLVLVLDAFLDLNLMVKPVQSSDKGVEITKSVIWINLGANHVKCDKREE